MAHGLEGPGGHITVSNPAGSALKEPPSSPPSLHLLDQTNRFPGDHRCTPAWGKKAAVCIRVAPLHLNGLCREVREKV